MKIPKIIFAVAGLHVLVIGLLMVQPGCQSSQKNIVENDDNTVVMETEENLEHEALLSQIASGEVVASEFNENLLNDNVPVAEVSTVNEAGRYPPQRPVDDALGLMNEPIAASAPVSAIAAPVDAGTYATSNSSHTYETYYVKPGDSLWKIAKSHALSLDQLMQANGLNKNSILHAGDAIRIPLKGSSPRVNSAPVAVAQRQATVPNTHNEGAVYIIKPGDSLSRIAAKFKTNIKAIKANNGLKSDTIYAGQELKIPQGSVSQINPSAPLVKRNGFESYQIKKGDTIGAISRRFTVPVPELMKLNGISNPRHIQSGQWLKIRAREGAVIDALPKSERATVIGPVESTGSMLEDEEDIPVYPVDVE